VISIGDKNKKVELNKQLHAILPVKNNKNIINLKLKYYKTRCNS
jgi:hypothetical protein